MTATTTDVGTADRVVTGPARRRRDRSDTAGRRSAMVWTGRLVVLVVVIALWETLVRGGVLSESDVSRPSLIWDFLVDQVPTSMWWLDTWTTVQEVLIGIGIGGGAGIVVGALLGLSPFVSDVLDPYIAMINSLPRIALYPLMLTWFGLGIGSKIALVIGIVFFITLVSTRAGMVAADADVTTSAVVLGASRGQRILHVDIPSAVPSIFGGVRLSISYGLLAAVTGEMLAGYQGLGQKVSLYSSNFDIAGVMGILLFLAVLATVLNTATGRLEAWLLRWREN